MTEGTNNQNQNQNPNQNSSTTQTAAGAGDKTFTQADVDRVVADRLERERKKYAGFEDYKKAKEELDALKAGQMSELEKAQAALAKAQKEAKDNADKIKALELTALKSRLAAESGLPAELADRIRGEDEAAIKADIEILKKVIPQKPAGGGGMPPSGAKAPEDLQTLYAEAIKGGRIEEAMIYKKQIFDKLGG